MGLRGHPGAGALSFGLTRSGDSLSGAPSYTNNVLAL